VRIIEGDGARRGQATQRYQAGQSRRGVGGAQHNMRETEHTFLIF
jgi:hypothetical protein